MSRRDTIPTDERCAHCRGFGWVQISYDPDRDEDCGACQGTGRKESAVNITTMQHPTQQIEVEAVRIDSEADLVALRATDWHEDQLRLLTFPTRVEGYIGIEPPLMLSGKRVPIPCTLMKGPGGDVDVLLDAS